MLPLVEPVWDAPNGVLLEVAQREVVAHQRGVDDQPRDAHAGAGPAAQRHDGQRRRDVQLPELADPVLVDIHPLVLDPSPIPVASAQRDEVLFLHVEPTARIPLLGEIFDSYRLPNFRDGFGFGGDRSGADETSSSATIDHDHGGGLTGATLREAFCAVTEEEGDLEDGRAAVSESSPPSSLPCGCGDCCAPKLLAECALRGLKPLSIAEVWMGVSTREEGDREEGEFYGACRGRCRPILGHMLCGADALNPRTKEKLGGPIVL